MWIFCHNPDHFPMEKTFGREKKKIKPTEGLRSVRHTLGCMPNEARVACKADSGSVTNLIAAAICSTYVAKAAPSLVVQYISYTFEPPKDISYKLKSSPPPTRSA